VSRLFPGLVEQRLPGGARIDFDKVSTQKGDFELAYWPEANYKGGAFGVGIIHNDFRAIDPDYYANSSRVKLEVYVDGKKIKTVVVNPEAVTNQDADPVFGTTYRARTNLKEGRDVLSTLAVVPDPKGGTRVAAKAPAVQDRKRSDPTPREGRAGAEKRAGRTAR
jgi:hypothetical protein